MPAQICCHGSAKLAVSSAYMSSCKSSDSGSLSPVIVKCSMAGEKFYFEFYF